MKFFIAKILILVFFVVSSNANENIRFININYIVKNSEAGKTLNKIIENKSKKIKLELNDLGKKIENKKEKIITQKNILKKDEYEKLVKNYEDEVKKFNNIRLKRNEDFNKYRINSQKKIIEALNPLITAFLKKESIQILLQKEQIIFGDKKLDITEEILKIFNDKHQKIKFE
ncbi:OmpH family outer membrane protein [Candidatus Pelagibacter sp.]|uniref:OmpH family outer membrane protein n=1 Tax=Candidatus Pelagibacter sp. TaxID=2024849 RepID=UPI003F864D8B